MGLGRNADGQLGIGNTTQQNAPIEITAVSGSLLENKKVVHVFSSQGDDDIGKTWFLTDEGKVTLLVQDKLMEFMLALIIHLELMLPPLSS